ncbi:hypothetical protein [Methylomusa anaerophila]|uniref:hypothetical protein n=1 Tax=Methylomusa anaerophila TaxID=1930071 RepID=UPI0013150AD4|nr:hypothetical protein [Methylomusa anaerophila]
MTLDICDGQVVGHKKWFSHVGKFPTLLCESHNTTGEIRHYQHVNLTIWEIDML